MKALDRLFADDPRQERPCPYCGTVFLRRHYLAMHLGKRHAVSLSQAEAEAYHAALDAEETVFVDLRRHVKASLVVLPLILFYFWALVALAQAGGNVAFGFMPLPGVVGFAALVYYMVWSRDAAPKVGGGPTAMVDDGRPADAREETVVRRRDP